jgi:phosphoglycolate phosphatase-like HAD superfamily hydrolase
LPKAAIFDLDGTLLDSVDLQCGDIGDLIRSLQLRGLAPASLRETIGRLERMLETEVVSAS